MRLSWREMGVGAKKCFNAHGNYPGVQKKDSNVGRRGWVSAGVRARITDQEGQSASLARGLRVLWVTAGKGGVWVKKGGVWAGKGGVWAQSQGNPLGFICPVPSAGNQGWFVCVLNPNQWVVLDACLSLPLTDSVQNISSAQLLFTTSLSCFFPSHCLLLPGLLYQASKLCPCPLVHFPQEWWFKK